MRSLICSALLLAVFTGSVHAMGVPGGGKGRTKIQFQFDNTAPTDSQFFAKIDVSAAIGQLGNPGTKSHNDDLSLQTITLTIGSASFTAYADISGHAVEDMTANPPQQFSAKLTGNGKILQINATGLNLKDLLPLNPTKSGSFTVEIDVAVNPTFDQSVLPISLSKQSVNFNYTVKKTKVQGKNI